MPLEPDDSYGLSAGSSRTETPAPRLAYEPRDPVAFRPRIGLVGCGGISVQHLRAYSAAGYDVAALCDSKEEKARRMRDAFFPSADVYDDWRKVIGRGDIEVVDLAAHPEQRVDMIGAALDAGRHVLSQKPFVTDLDVGLRLVEKAEKKGVRLAVNQNGRWAPHWSWIRQAIAENLLGEVTSVRVSVNWDHNWIAGSLFEDVRFLILYDFGIHWFDIVSRFLHGRKPLRVNASAGAAPGQKVRPPLLSQAIVEYDAGQASLFFDANTRFGEQDTTCVTGTLGTARSTGPDLNTQEVTLATAAGIARPALRGTWFPDGFHGTMGELLCAVEEKREPENGARENLESLALCFAALQSAAKHVPAAPWSVRKMPV
jgi:predicted dehydrogenase